MRCINGHLLPDEQHPDSGTGYVGEDGRAHYFVGSYNSWVVETYQQWCRDLSFAWLFTEDERYARTCAAILDSIAEIYPYCDMGAWDYPSDPPSGRLNRPWYQTARVLVTLVDYYDRIYDSAALDEPSWVEGLSRRENIELNLLKNGAAYCYEQSLKGSLNNGEADYLRGTLAVGCLLGIPEYIDWAIDGPFGIRAMVANNSDRDGRYTETSLPYAIHARRLYLTFAEPMINYRGGSYPEGLNLYDDPGFRSFYELPRLTVDLAGHFPTYGDSAPDTKLRMPPERPFDRSDYQFAERIAARASAPAVRAHFRGIVRALAGDDLESRRASSGDTEWLLFHATEIGQEDGPSRELPELVRDSLVLGEKGLAILRTPPGEHASACLLRYGPTLNHGHYDDLNINYVAQGYEVTYDLGYAGGARHVQVGWAKQTASHQLVVVDELRQQPDTNVDGTGGSLHTFAAMPGLALVEADADGVYRSRGVEDYRRLVALVGDASESYLLDIFHVLGGERHDYQAHSLSEELIVEGFDPGPTEAGSLAGEDFDWGDRLLNDGYLRGVPHRPYWVAPPGNGYGFMMAPRRARTASQWSATWILPDHQRRTRLTVLPESEMEVITTRAPGVRNDRPGAACVTARRDGPAPLRSAFVALREAFAPETEGTRGVRTADGGALEFSNQASLLLTEVELPAGEYTLHLSGSGPTTGSDSFFVTVGGDRYAFSVPKNESGTAAAISGAELAEGPVTIERDGVQEVKIAPREHGPIMLTELTFAREGEEPLRLAAGDLLAAARWPEAAVPVLADATRHATAEGAVALTVDHRSGLRDSFLHSSDERPLDAIGLRLEGRLAHARFNGERLQSLRVIGRSVATGGTRIELERPERRGRIVSVDVDLNRVRVDVALPADGRLADQIVTFSNPDYSRNSAYTIRGVTRDGDGSVIDLGPQRVVLGRGTLGEDGVQGRRLLSVTPHEAARGLTREGTDVFAGKLVTNEDGSARAKIVATNWGQPYEMEVTSTDGFRPGDAIRYHDLQAGDAFLIRNWACAVFDASGVPTVHATDDATLTMDGETHAIPWATTRSQE
ncbi:MAG: hypothetical protein GF393_07845 [Armatimonadia bacterium]|nr:hypothetical protein [Armatimonadia bacterium]